MLEGANPSELIEAKGEALWKQARGPKNALLERCDLGKSPGVFMGVNARGAEANAPSIKR
jgi:L-cysteine S-thiosulfotransferase